MKRPLVLALMFALGVLAGLGVAPLLRPTRPVDLHGALRELGLRPEQQKRIDAIVDRHGPEVEEILRDVRPKLDELQGRVASEIEAELDDAQRDTFRKLRQRRRGPPP